MLGMEGGGERRLLSSVDWQASASEGVYVKEPERKHLKSDVSKSHREESFKTKKMFCVIEFSREANEDKE